jgi:hypothetical protein
MMNKRNIYIFLIITLLISISLTLIIYMYIMAIGTGKKTNLKENELEIKSQLQSECDCLITGMEHLENDDGDLVNVTYFNLYFSLGDSNWKNRDSMYLYQKSKEINDKLQKGMSNKIKCDSIKLTFDFYTPDGKNTRNGLVFVYPIKK